MPRTVPSAPAGSADLTIVELERLKRHWLRKDLCEKTGLHIETIERLERREGVVHEKTIFALSKVLGIDALTLRNDLNRPAQA